MTSPTLWNQLLVWPILNLLILFYKMVEFLRLPGPLGWAIILLTVAIRLLLYPLMHAQLKSAKKMQSLKPHMDALSAKHKNDKQALQQAQLALYKEHGVNPAAGCLPMLVQFPVLIALYNVFYQVLNNGNLEKIITDINGVLYLPVMKLGTLDLTFFGVNLGIKPNQWQQHGVWLLAVPVLTGLLQWYQTRLMMSATTTPSDKQQAAIKKSQDTKTGDTKSNTQEDTAGEMQKQMAMITPIMFGFFALQFPLGLALYWNIFGLFGIMQQLRINKS